MWRGWNVPQSSEATPNDWEAAYLRFETPEEEVRKFIRRLRKLGADAWDREAAVVELFCGRGNGLHALERLGFAHVEGVDLSAALAAEYEGIGRVQVADCRELPFADESKDIAIVQGGLHHLAELPGDLERTLGEARRVLRKGGRFVAVEPWLTPFLRGVHAMARSRWMRRMWERIDALATMIEHERRTYEQWLRHGAGILRLLRGHFEEEACRVGWGKLMFAGRKK